MKVDVNLFDEFAIIITTFDLCDEIIVDAEHINDEKYNISVYLNEFEFELSDGTVIQKNPGDGYTNEMKTDWEKFKYSKYYMSKFHSIEPKSVTHCIKPKHQTTYDREISKKTKGETISLVADHFLYVATGTIKVLEEVHTAPILIKVESTNATVEFISDLSYTVKFRGK